MREICRIQGIDTALERSRSGNGAHIWIFFEQPIPARTARRFGAALLAKGTETMHRKDFNTFDRMMPTQDEMPAGGMGNLIALPLQGIPRKQKNSVFVDDDWNVVPDQWKYLSGIKCLSPEFVERKIAEWGWKDKVAAEDSSISEEGKPWERKMSPGLEKAKGWRNLLLYRGLPYDRTIHHRFLPRHVATGAGKGGCNHAGT